MTSYAACWDLPKQMGMNPLLQHQWRAGIAWHAFQVVKKCDFATCKPFLTSTVLIC